MLEQISWLAQVPDRVIITPDGAIGRSEALFFSEPRFFIALLGGLLLAFAFQLLLTNLSVAAGISYLGGSSDRQRENATSFTNVSDLSDMVHEDRNESTVAKVGTAIGLWTVITVSLALFAACLLAVKLSLINNAVLGAIVGLVIWAAYFSLMVWISTTAVGSLIGSVFNAATSGFQAIVGTATNAIGAKVAKDQIVSTAEAAASAVRREIMGAIDPETVKENLQDYLTQIKPTGLDLQNIQQEFERLLQDRDFLALAKPENIGKIDRQTFVDLVSSRSDLSKKEVNQVVDRLEKAWKKTVSGIDKSDPVRDLVDYLKSTQPGKELFGDLDNRLKDLVGQLGPGQQNQGSGVISQLFGTLTGAVLARTDLSDLDVEKVLGQIKKAKNQLSEPVKDESPSVSTSTTRLDVENYLLNTYSWRLNPESIDQDFANVIYDSDADAKVMRRELENLKRQDFVELLQSRGVFTADKIQKLADRLETVRQSVLDKLTKAQEAEATRELQTELVNYLKTAPKDRLLNQDPLAQDIKRIIEDEEADAQTMRSRLGQFNRIALVNVLIERPDLNPEEAEQITDQIARVFGIIVADMEGLQQAAEARISAQWQKVQDYLRNTGRNELNPEVIKLDFQTLLEDPETGAKRLRYRAGQFDRDTLVQLLSQRQDVTPEEANHIIDQVEANWNRVTHAPQIVADKASEKYQEVTTAIGDYLRNTGKSQLNPEGIKRDLQLLLQNPKLGARALGDRLSQMDRDTLVKLLSQREDLSEAEVNAAIDSVQDTLRSAIRAPKRLALRTQAQISDFQTTLADYLRNTGKEELNPAGIQRDLQILLNDPRLGVEKLSDRLSKIDRDTLVKLISQREDISPAEAEEIVDRILAVRDRFMEQIQAIQERIQASMDRVFSQIRSYLNALERPELNYDGIKKDLRQMFDDPQAGFEAMRDRFSQVDRGTLIAILSSREDISQADAERIVNQIEGTRDGILRRAERIQQEVQRRLDEIKRQAQHQVEETRKAASVAAWWLFGTAITSALVSALAGALAVAS
jgi:nucleoid DNA-binding protein/DNA-binding transcriptional regulator YhcF (GntR family)